MSLDPFQRFHNVDCMHAQGAGPLPGLRSSRWIVDWVEGYASDPIESTVQAILLQQVRSPRDDSDSGPVILGW
jgi:hypothetical protein